MRINNYSFGKCILMVLTVLLFSQFSYGLLEYDDVVFYPNGSQNINISKLIIDIGNYTIFNLNIKYKNRSYHFNRLMSNTTVDLPITPINISVKIEGSKISSNQWKIDYTVYNNYNYNILVNISFSDEYSPSNTTLNIPPHSSKTVVFYKTTYSNTIYFPNSNISYTVYDTAAVSYSKYIPFSIEKKHDIINGSDVWKVKYIIYNPYNKTSSIKALFWAEINNTNITLGNINTTIYPYKNYTKNYTITTNNIPIFYIKLNNSYTVNKNVSIKPSFKVGNSYIIGIGLVKGRSFIYNPPPVYSPIKHTKTEEKKVENKPKEEIPKNEKSNGEEGNNNEKHVENKPKEETSKNEKPAIISENIKKYFFINNKNSISLYGITIKKIDDIKDISILFISQLIPLVIIVLTILFNILIKVIALKKIDVSIFKYINIFPTLSSSKVIIKNIYPLKLNLVEPNKFTTSLIHEVFDIPLHYAESIYIAIATGSGVITDDKKIYNFCKKIGIDVEYIPTKKI